MSTEISREKIIEYFSRTQYDFATILDDSPRNNSYVC